MRASDEAGVRHVMFSLAAFTAFIAFYSFAGAPTLRLVSGAPHFFQLLVVTTATLFLVRRIGRRQRDFSEETLARTIIAKWPWTDAPPPRDLHEAFLIHTIRSQGAGRMRARGRARSVQRRRPREREQRRDVARRRSTGSIRCGRGLRITEADHERVMSELVEEDRARTTDGNAHALARETAAARGVRRRAGGLPGRGGVERAAPWTMRSFSGFAMNTPSPRMSTVSCSTRWSNAARASPSYILDAPATIEELAATIRAIEPPQSPVDGVPVQTPEAPVDPNRRHLPPGARHAETTQAAARERRCCRRIRRVASAAIVDLGARLSPATAARLDGCASTCGERCADRRTASILASAVAQPRSVHSRHGDLHPAVIRGGDRRRP